jgi:dTDP-4-amino-4,6-dideoxygalactose transaminase
VSYIGGFFGIELPPADVPGLASFWNMPIDPALTYVNGRSALAALFASVRPSKLWLPAYICRSVVQAAETAGTAFGFFPVNDGLQPDAAFLDSVARAGEIVLAVDYFGRSPDLEFLDFVERRRDLRFIEDACHAFDTGEAQWGHWCLRSPRKLVGVPDGGFLVPADDILGAQRSLPQPGVDTSEAAWMRFEDEDEHANALWHGVNQSREAAEQAAPRRMSRLSREVLSRLPIAPIAERRRINFRVLAGKLEEIMFLPEKQPSYVPLGFPVRLQRDLRTRVRNELIANGIFPALHWIDLPSPAAFTTAHTLASELLTLPCDQRYGSVQMERVARIVMEALSRR